MNQASEDRKKSFSERALTSSKDRTKAKGRKTSRKGIDRTVTQTAASGRTKPTTGMDRYAGHNHKKSDGCLEGCPKYVTKAEVA